jgi:hypothetical protein
MWCDVMWRERTPQSHKSHYSYLLTGKKPERLTHVEPQYDGCLMALYRKLRPVCREFPLSLRLSRQLTSCKCGHCCRSDVPCYLRLQGRNVWRQWQALQRAVSFLAQLSGSTVLTCLEGEPNPTIPRTIILYSRCRDSSVTIVTRDYGLDGWVIFRQPRPALGPGTSIPRVKAAEA